MVDFTLAIPYLDKFFDTIFSILAPVLALIMFAMIMGFTFVFFRIFFKMFMLFRLLGTLFYDVWIKYNRDELRLPDYARKDTFYRYDLEGWRSISAMFKDATSFW